MSFVADPFYLDVHGPAGWVRQQTEQLRGVHVKVAEDLEHPGYCSPDGRTVTVRPGLPFSDFHWILACSVIASVFGFEATPDLLVKGPPRLISAPSPGDAQIIPLRQWVISGPIAGGLPR